MKYVMAICIVLGVVIGISFLLSWPVMVLWNGCLVDADTSLRPITWTQAWGITALFGLLFKSSQSSAEVK